MCVESSPLTADFTIDFIDNNSKHLSSCRLFPIRVIRVEFEIDYSIGTSSPADIQLRFMGRDQVAKL